MKRLLAVATMATLCGGLNCALLPAAARAHDADAADARDPNDTWFAAFGGGAWAHPRFPGSDSTYAQPLPYFDVRYRRLFLVSGDGLGAYLFRSHGGWAAVSVAPELRQRLQSDDDRLRGLGDVRRTARAEFQAGYAADCFTAKGDVATDIAHRGQGTIVDLSLIAHHVVFGRLQVESGVAAQWANRLFDESFYGITAAQSTASGLPEYSAGSGLDELRVFFGANFAIDRHWFAVGRVAAVHLGRRAADSPITERRTDAEFQLFAAYLGREVQNRIRAEGGSAVYIRADVRDETQVKSFIDHAVSIYGRLDVAFNNAGITLERPLHEYGAAEWDDVINTNLRGVFLAMKYQIPYMLAGGGGNIVITSSSNAIATTEKRSAYSASKRGLIGLVQSAALDYAQHGIRVNALIPGTTDTALVRRSAGMEHVPDGVWELALNQWAHAHVPGLQRVAQPEEIAAFALVLASNDLPYMTGAQLVMDGGKTAHAG